MRVMVIYSGICVISVPRMCMQIEIIMNSNEELEST